jgi:hypothetical protein
MLRIQRFSALLVQEIYDNETPTHFNFSLNAIFLIVVVYELSEPVKAIGCQRETGAAASAAVCERETSAGGKAQGCKLNNESH